MFNQIIPMCDISVNSWICWTLSVCSRHRALARSALLVILSVLLSLSSPIRSSIRAFICVLLFVCYIGLSNCPSHWPSVDVTPHHRLFAGCPHHASEIMAGKSMGLSSAPQHAFWEQFWPIVSKKEASSVGGQPKI